MIGPTSGINRLTIGAYIAPLVVYEWKLCIIIAQVYTLAYIVIIHRARGTCRWHRWV